MKPLKMKSMTNNLLKPSTKNRKVFKAFFSEGSRTPHLHSTSSSIEYIPLKSRLCPPSPPIMTRLYSHFIYTVPISPLPKVLSMLTEISKTHFKAQALEVMRSIEQSGEPVIITTHGKKTLMISQYKDNLAQPLDRLKGSIVCYNDPTAPISEGHWELG